MGQPVRNLHPLMPQPPETVEVMWVTVWYGDLYCRHGSDAPVRVDTPVTDLRSLFPGCSSVTVTGERSMMTLGVLELAPEYGS